MSDNKVKVGVVGCGNISGVYLKAVKMFECMEIAALADLLPERAQAKAAEYGVPKAYGVADLLADPEIDVVLNLTVPLAHAEVAMSALESGKSVYNEKPLGVRREDGRSLLEMAGERNLRVGCAPDTFLGAGLQTCRKLIDEGAIGVPVAATAFMMGHGPEHFHPDPDFFYQPGGGPMFDMGPYYLTALIHLIGPVRRVTGSARISFPERTITSQPNYGKKIQVRVPTHVAGVLDFECGAIGTIITSLDVWAAQVPRIEIYGSEGTLSVPDPNTFGGPVRIRMGREGEWQEVPLTHGYAGQSRSVGLADMVTAMRSGREHRACGSLAYHVLDIMHAVHDASREGRHIELESQCARPAALPTGLADGELD